MPIYGPYVAHIWAIYGLYMVIYGPYMVIYGHIWPIYGHIWPCMAHIWPYIAIYGLIWSIYGHIWATYGPYMIAGCSAPPLSQSSCSAPPSPCGPVENARKCNELVGGIPLGGGPRTCRRIPLGGGLRTCNLRSYMAMGGDLVQYGHIWAIYGHIWPYMAMYMAIYGHVP